MEIEKNKQDYSQCLAQSNWIELDFVYYEKGR